MTKEKRIEPSDLKSHIGYWMRIVSNSVSHAFAAKLGKTSVTVAEWVILREMYSANDTIAPSKVATLTGLTRGAISKIIERLVQKKYVTRSEASEDRRYQDIKLTPSGISLIPQLAALADKNDDDFFSFLTKEEKKQLIGLLRKIVDHHHLNRHPVE